MTMQIKSEYELQQMIKTHYKKDEMPDIILKTSSALEFMLTLGFDSMRLTLKMYDLGVKPNELGLSMALAMKRTDDKYLSATDQAVKNEVLAKHANMIKELEKVLA